MATPTVRFTVANADRTMRGATWRCWTTNRDDSVYLACRELRGSLHLSLHETGQWHVAFAEEIFDSLFDPENRPESRFCGQWLKPKELAPGLVAACRILIPWYGITVPVTSSAKNVAWISAPNQGMMCEVTVLLSAPAASTSLWPGARSMGMSLVGSFGLGNEGRVWLVSRETPLVEPKLPPVCAPKYFRGASPELLDDGALRVIGWGDCDDGAIGFFESPAVVRPVRE